MIKFVTNSHPKAIGFDGDYIKSINIQSNVKLNECGTEEEQKEISEKHQHTPQQQRRAKLFTNHVNKTERNL